MAINPIVRPNLALVSWAGVKFGIPRSTGCLNGCEVFYTAAIGITNKEKVL